MAVLIVAGLAIIGFTIFNNITSPGSSDKNHESNYHFQTCKYIGKINSFNEQEVVVCTSSGNSSLFIKLAKLSEIDRFWIFKYFSFIMAIFKSL